MANPSPTQSLQPEQLYRPHDAVAGAAGYGMFGAGAGFFAAAVQNSLAKQHVGVMGVFTKHGGTIATFTIAPTVYKFVKDATANLREKDDSWNTALGAFVGGALIGMRSGRMPQLMLGGSVASALLTVFEVSGGLGGTRKNEDQTMDEYDYKEWIRKNRRRPITETIEWAGEGRGIQGPGYAERRAARLREKYGVEINPIRADGS